MTEEILKLMGTVREEMGEKSVLIKLKIYNYLELIILITYTVCTCTYMYTCTSDNMYMYYFISLFSLSSFLIKVVIRIISQFYGF